MAWKMHNITLSFSSMYQWMTGWWLSHRSEKYEFVSWDDDIPNIRKNKSHVPNHQPDDNDALFPCVANKCHPKPSFLHIDRFTLGSLFTPGSPVAPVFYPKICGGFHLEVFSQSWGVPHTIHFRFGFHEINHP